MILFCLTMRLFKAEFLGIAFVGWVPTEERRDVKGAGILP